MIERASYPVGDVVRCFVSQAVASGLAGDELEEHDAIAVDIASGCDIRFDIRWIDVARRSHGACQHVRGIGTEVGNLGVEVVVQENVCGLHVTVDDGWVTFFVEIC